MGRKILVLGVLFLTILAPNSSAAGDAGVDVNPEGDEPFTVIERTTPSVDKETWSLTIEMKQEAYDNGTTFQIVTQICTNDGVCDPPVTMDAEITERLHSISLSPPNDHSYVNWRVKATDSDGNNTNHPHGDWFTTWSSCWYTDGTWGGIDSLSDGGCSNDSEETPGFTTVITMTAMTLAIAIVAKRKIYQK